MSKEEPQSIPYYQKRACEFVDMLHDTKLVNPEVKRKDLQDLENYLAYMYQSTADSAIKAYEFTQKVKHLQ